MDSIKSIGAATIDTGAITLSQDLGEQYRSKAEELSLRLYHASNFAKLMAFAFEARRNLTETHEVISRHPEMQKVIYSGVKRCTAWTDFGDVSSDVLEFLGLELEALNREVSANMYLMSEGKAVTLKNLD